MRYIRFMAILPPGASTQMATGSNRVEVFGKPFSYAGRIFATHRVMRADDEHIHLSLQTFGASDALTGMFIPGSEAGYHEAAKSAAIAVLESKGLEKLNDAVGKAARKHGTVSFELLDASEELTQ